MRKVVCCIAAACIFFLAGCAFDGAQNVTVVDNNGTQVSDVLVIPLYAKSFGILLGPDGNRVFTADKSVITKPFRFNSGDDLMSKKEATKGLMLPLLVFVGNINAVKRWLIAKKGFIPKVLTGDVIYQKSPIVMTKGGNVENDRLVEMLISPTDQTTLKRRFGVASMKGDIAVSLEEKDIALLGRLKSD